MRRSLVVFVTALMTMVGISIAPALATPSAGAGDPGSFSCGHAWSNKDPGFGHVIPTSAPMHTGPHASCSTILNVRSTDGLDYHCFVWNESGNTWTHVRISNTNIQGWIWDDYLTSFGSSYQC